MLNPKNAVSKKNLIPKIIKSVCVQRNESRKRNDYKKDAKRKNIQESMVITHKILYVLLCVK